ncbi:MAG: TonB-dependent receptor, partial [Bryobacterales bacterium]|nr:TonB-dependent receptor [Bryobacterales bacterium]
MMRVNRNRGVVFFSILLSTFLVPGCYGQAVAVAEVHGQVLDSSNSTIPGAQVKMTQTATQYVRSATSGADGTYSLPNLPVGPYTFEVTAAGFKTYVQSGIILQVGSSIQVNATLQVGAVTENIQVTAGANMVETRSNSVAQVIDERRIMELPLNGRQATDLIVLSGGATPTPPANMTSSKNYPSSTTMSVAGGQGNGTNYLLDGGDNVSNFTNVNMPFPFPDALQEFSVETSSLPARNGLHPGGVVNVVTKSGTNQLHGDWFEFLRNGNVNACNFFGTTHDSLKRNQFGGTLGSRIVRDKLFFFGGFQLTRNRQNPPQSISYVPTPAALAGDFRDLESAACQSNRAVRVINDPTTRQPFPNAQVPVSRFNPASLKMNGYLPASNDPCGKVTYGVPTTGDEDQIIGRIDWTQSARHSVFGRYFLTQYRNPGNWDPKNALVTTRAGNLMRSQSFTLADTFSINPTTLNAFHATFHRMRNDRGPSSKFINAKDQLGIDVFAEVANYLEVSVSNAFSVGCGTCAPGFFNINTFAFADDVDLIRGRHQIALGVNILRSQDNLNSGYRQNAGFTFNGQTTNDSMVDFELGIMSQFTQSRAQLSWYRKINIGLYVQDTIRVSRRLSVNAGLRWEPDIPPVDTRRVG